MIGERIKVNKREEKLSGFKKARLGKTQLETQKSLEQNAAIRHIEHTTWQ